MPRPHPPEFRQRAVELARLREKPLKEIAADLGISESCLRAWVAKMENEILKRAAAFFAQENVLPK
jgi:transposase-like protein